MGTKPNQAFNQDLFSSDVNFTIEEASGSVDGQHVIAKVSGCFFVPEGVSRNKRYYSNKLWEKQLSKPTIKSFLSEKRMFGTIGHQQPIDDQALLEGKLSHIITDLALDKNGVKGFGEAFILGTPAGQILNTVLRSGAKLFTSSRAMGKFNGVTEDGTPRVDEDSYDLKTFDFVIDPGFLQANPALAESLEDIENGKPTNNNGSNLNLNPGYQGENSMEHEIIKKAMDEAANLRSDLNKSITEFNNQNKIVVDQNKEIVSLKEQLKVLELYKALGSVEAIKKIVSEFKEASTALAKIKTYGSVEEVCKSIDVSLDVMKKYTEMGTPAEIGKALTGAKSLLEQYQPLGTPKSIDRVLEKFKGIVVNFKKNEDEKKIKALATEIGVSESAVKKVYGTMKIEEIRKFFKEILEQEDNGNRYRKTAIASVNETKPAGAAGSKEAPWKRGSSAERLFESLGAGVEFKEEKV